MVFLRFGRWYSRCLRNHPWKTHIITSGCLASTGDIIAQLALEKRNLNEYNYKRTIRFFGFGGFYFGPLLRGWSIILNCYVHLRTLPRLSPLLRVVIDQGLFVPCLYSVFLVILRLSLGHDFETALRRWRNDFFDIYVAALKVWPATHLIHFYLMPSRYQMRFVQLVTVFWISYVSWRVNNKPVDSI